MDERTEPDDSTLEAEHSEEGRTHVADRPPTSEEEAAADEQQSQAGAEELRRVAEHYEEMNRIGANVRGEGRIP